MIKKFRPVKILTMCRVGLSRSLALADVLKFHFVPTDVIPVGVSANSAETLKYMVDWADKVVLMREKFRNELEEKIGVPLPNEKILICEVGADVHGYVGQNRAILIDKAWRWARANQKELGVVEK